MKALGRLSPLTIAVVVLVIGLATPAVGVPLITGQKVKDGSLTGKDVKDRSLTPSDFKDAVRGPRGAQGPQGLAGPRGEQGPAGPRGEQGPAGPRGEQGQAGPAGMAGLELVEGPLDQLCANDGSDPDCAFDFTLAVCPAGKIATGGAFDPGLAISFATRALPEGYAGFAGNFINEPADIQAFVYCAEADGAQTLAARAKRSYDVGQLRETLALFQRR
jgi:Collagen triple helix repeat (20 copies)